MFQTGSKHAPNKSEFPESRLYLITTGFLNNEVFPENQAPTKHQRGRIIRAAKLSHAQVQRIRMKLGILLPIPTGSNRQTLKYPRRHQPAHSTINAHTKPREYL